MPLQFNRWSQFSASLYLVSHCHCTHLLCLVSTVALYVSLLLLCQALHHYRCCCFLCLVSITLHAVLCSCLIIIVTTITSCTSSLLPHAPCPHHLMCPVTVALCPLLLSLCMPHHRCPVPLVADILLPSSHCPASPLAHAPP